MAIAGHGDGTTERADLVACWAVPLVDGVHSIEFEHGTTSGRRVVRVDGVEIIRRDWMFRLVGEERFVVGKHRAKCELRVDPLPHFTFGYSLYVDGKPLEKFSEKQAKAVRMWAVIFDGKRYRIALEKQTLDLWVNGNLVEAETFFIDGGTEMRFGYEGLIGTIKATSTDKKNGVVHRLFIDGNFIEEENYLK